MSGVRARRIGSWAAAGAANRPKARAARTGRLMGNRRGKPATRRETANRSGRGERAPEKGRTNQAHEIHMNTFSSLPNGPGDCKKEAGGQTRGRARVDRRGG